MSRGRNKTIEVEALTHKEAKRRNIPTAEFESLMREEDKSPVQLAYERRNRDLGAPEGFDRRLAPRV
jgi:adenine-specific DNA-methyltransferase